MNARIVGAHTPIPNNHPSKPSGKNRNTAISRVFSTDTNGRSSTSTPVTIEPPSEPRPSIPSAASHPSLSREPKPVVDLNEVSYYFNKIYSVTDSHIHLERFPWKNYWIAFLFISFGVAGYLLLPVPSGDEKDNFLSWSFSSHSIGWIPWFLGLIERNAKFSWNKFFFTLVWVLAGILQPAPTEGIYCTKSVFYQFSYFPQPLASIVSLYYYIRYKQWPKGDSSLPHHLRHLPNSARIHIVPSQEIVTFFAQSYDKIGSAWRVSLRTSSFVIPLTWLCVNDYSLNGFFANATANLLRGFYNCSPDPGIDDYLERQSVAEEEVKKSR